MIFNFETEYYMCFRDTKNNITCTKYNNYIPYNDDFKVISIPKILPKFVKTIYVYQEFKPKKINFLENKINRQEIDYKHPVLYM